jgi:hypothetical protein
MSNVHVLVNFYVRSSVVGQLSQSNREVKKCFMWPPYCPPPSLLYRCYRNESCISVEAGFPYIIFGPYVVSLVALWTHEFAHPPYCRYSFQIFKKARSLDGLHWHKVHINFLKNLVLNSAVGMRWRIRRKQVKISCYCCDTWSTSDMIVISPWNVLELATYMAMTRSLDSRLWNWDVPQEGGDSEQATSTRYAQLERVSSTKGAQWTGRVCICRSFATRLSTFRKFSRDLLERGICVCRSALKVTEWI